MLSYGTVRPVKMVTIPHRLDFELYGYDPDKALNRLFWWSSDYVKNEVKSGEISDSPTPTHPFFLVFLNFFLIKVI